MSSFKDINSNSVLIVDDEISTRAILKARLGQKEGYDILEAANGTEALEKIFENQPDVVILDWKMPDLTGIEVLKELRQNEETHDIPVIMLTSKKLVSDVEEAFESGALAFIAKPLDLQQISQKVGFYINQKQESS
ncbi:response regulator [Curvivirga sp.]|uniref:response regulator n=1 Tax=Curvivirga sp. TaxID=2856848 RepID=UPI003B58C4EC